MDESEQLASLTVEVANIKEKVYAIDSKLEAIGISSRLAVLEDRQATVFKLAHAVIGVFGTVISGIIIWLFTK